MVGETDLAHKNISSSVSVFWDFKLSSAQSREIHNLGNVTDLPDYISGRPQVFAITWNDSGHESDVFFHIYKCI